MDQNKEEHNVNYKKINLQKLNIVTHGNFDNELLGGIDNRITYKYLMIRWKRISYTRNALL